MTPSSSSTTSRPARTSSRTAAKLASVKRVAATKSAPSTTAKRTSAAKSSKRGAVPKAGARKRMKRADSEDDQEEDEEQEEREDEGDQDDYEDKDKEEDDQDKDDSDMDDFEDTNYDKNSKGRTNTTKASSSKGRSSTVKSTNPDLLPAPSKTFLVSSLVIPRPKKPVADAIQPETLEFIRDLKLNNDREYFRLNEARWLAAKHDFLDFIRMIKEGLLEADPNIMNQEPKDSIMRIYRDVRFSNDKSPYKNQLACFFSKGGKKAIAAGYYFGVSSDGGTFAGCGVWDHSGPALHRIRQGIANHSDRFKEILETEAIKRITGGKTGLDALQPGSQLKTRPVGFDKHHPMIEYLKRKCFAIRRDFTDKEVVNEGFLEEVLQTFDAGVNLVHILNEWIG
ncbi:hypothetical protein BGZ65_005547 [Modicella reniformis]|uniref:DUF2461 domain-containing protein n=1 Tax=Modicella reniformis TaxID=1440133 RepID=A0A9P6SV40_9FUNG|nr:hypothetical protein BGZ65_005547 [Modicella reniformis]